MKTLTASIAFAALIIGGTAVAGDSPAPKNAYLYIGWPNDGEMVRKSNFRVWFGLRNMGVAPASVKKSKTGHHHLIIDAPLPPMDEEIPSDKHHLHFGKGQTETRVTLTPGTHTLQLLLGDHNHVPHNPPVMSRKITITVK
ncbi:MAG: DUF4399 domain-containing protein [Gammaproteobacteria bacterium]|jgi:hypothetical protein|nr:DUF4399 domain-containing protein [Gammaproteobacteria bacterium]NCF81269.1 DUF4399 domain-containing protein [Pseudomonadota bacterium]